MAHLFEPFTVSVVVEGPTAVISPEGALDITSVPILEEALDNASALSAERVILDVKKLSFADASGLKAVLRASNVRRHRLTLRGAGRQMRHIFEFIGVTPLVGFDNPDRQAPQRMGDLNIAYIRRLWRAFAAEGALAVAQLVDDDADWKPLGAGGRVLHGREQLIKFWASETSPPPTPHSFIAVGNRVLVWSELSIGDGPHKQLWSLYRLERRRLLEAVTFERKTEAHAILARE